MKNKLIYFILLISSLVYANNLDKAMKFYEEKNYKKSYEISKDILKNSPANIQANIIFADSSLYLGSFHEALKSYERVLMQNKNDIYSRIQMARIYLLTNNKTMLDLEIENLQRRKLSNSQKKALLELKSNQNSENKINSIYGFVSIGLLHDSNKNNNIGNKNFYVPSINLNLKGNKKKKATAAVQNINLNHNYANKNFFLNSSLNLYNKNYFDNKTNNLTMANILLSPGFIMNDYFLSMPIKYDKVLLSGHSYMQVYGLGLDLKKSFNNSLIQTGYLYSLNKYKEKAKDYNSHELYFGGRTYLDKQRTFLLSIMLNAEFSKEKRNLRSDVSYNAYGIDFNLQKELNEKMMLSTAFGAKKYKYKDYDLSFLNKRKDTLLIYSIGANYNFTKALNVGLGINYLDKKSNQSINEYDKLLNTVNLIYKF